MGLLRKENVGGGPLLSSGTKPKAAFWVSRVTCTHPGSSRLWVMYFGKGPQGPKPIALLLQLIPTTDAKIVKFQRRNYPRQ